MSAKVSGTILHESDTVGEYATKHLTQSITNRQSIDFSLL